MRKGLPRQDDVVGFFAKRFIDNPNLMDVRFEITRNCNFGCHYCPTHELNFYHPDYDMLRRMSDFLIDMDDKVFYLNLIGGEPTTNPNLKRILQYFLVNLSKKRLKKTEICLSTNFSQSLQYYKEIVDLVRSYDIGSFNFFPSYHRGHISLDTFVDLYEWALSENCIVVGAFMLFHEKCLQQYSSVSKIKKLRPRPVSGKEYLLDIEEEQKSRYEVFNNLTVVKHNQNFYFEKIQYPFDFNFKNFVCYSIKNNMVISYDGSVHYCINRMDESPVMTVFDKVKTSKEYTVCPLILCNCNFGIPKIKLDHFRDFKRIERL